MRTPGYYPKTITGMPNSRYPYGQYKDAKNGASGTKMEAAHINDLAYALLTVLHNADIRPDETLEDTYSSQFMQALDKLYNKEWSEDKASNGGYRVGARVVQNGIEYINQIPDNRVEPASQTELLGTDQQTLSVIGNGWQIIRDYNTAQTLQNWLMPKVGEQAPYKIYAQDGKKVLLTVVPAPKIESFLYAPENMDEIASFGYFPLTLNADGTPKVFTDTNNALSSVQKKILERYVSAGYIKRTDTNAYSVALANLKAGFGLVGFGGANPIGTTTGGIADNALNHLISSHTHTQYEKWYLLGFGDNPVSGFDTISEIRMNGLLTHGIFGIHSELSQPLNMCKVTESTIYPADWGVSISSRRNSTTGDFTVSDTNDSLSVSVFGAQTFSAEGFGTRPIPFVANGEINGDSHIDKAWADQHPNTSAGLQVCYGIPISSASKH